MNEKIQWTRKRQGESEYLFICYFINLYDIGAKMNYWIKKNIIGTLFPDLNNGGTEPLNHLG